MRRLEMNTVKSVMTVVRFVASVRRTTMLAVMRLRARKMLGWANTNVDLVVDAYYSAVSSRFPKVRYHVGAL